LKKNQWIVAGAGILLTISLFVYFIYGDHTARIKEQDANTNAEIITIDSILVHAKERLTPDQLTRINLLENSISRGNVTDQQLTVYHRLEHFWKDTARVPALYAWYNAEAARLENSEKKLNFAAHLFLNILRSESNAQLRKWEALQAKELFERSLKINPVNDSARVGIGACYLFGEISPTPMEGILMIRTVAEKDSTNVFAQMMLGHGSVLSGQYEKAIDRFQNALLTDPDNTEALLMIVKIAEEYEKSSQTDKAVAAYSIALRSVKKEEWRSELQKRIDDLKKK